MLSRVIATLFLATGLAWLAACASPGLPNQGGTYIAVPAEVAASTPRRLPKAAPQQPAFNYPVDALRDRLTGKVLLQFRIDANGNVQSAQVIAADAAPILREAALNYLRRQTFLLSGASFDPTDPTPFRVTVIYCITRCPDVAPLPGSITLAWITGSALPRR
jgi:TonB family protein